MKCALVQEANTELPLRVKGFRNRISGLVMKAKQIGKIHLGIGLERNHQKPLDSLPGKAT